MTRDKRLRAGGRDECSLRSCDDQTSFTEYDRKETEINSLSSQKVTTGSTTFKNTKMIRVGSVPPIVTVNLRHSWTALLFSGIQKYHQPVVWAIC